MHLYRNHNFPWIIDLSLITKQVQIYTVPYDVLLKTVVGIFFFTQGKKNEEDKLICTNVR